MSRRKQAKPRAFKNGQPSEQSIDETDNLNQSNCSSDCGTELDFDEENEMHLKNSPLLLQSDDSEMEEQIDEETSCDSFYSDIYSSHTSLTFSPSLSEGAATPNSLIQHDGVIENNLLNDNITMVEQAGFKLSSNRSENDEVLNGKQAKMASPTVANQVHKLTAKNKLATRLPANGEGSYKCQFCKKVFPRLGYLKKHEQSHAEHMPFRCDYCSRLFKHKRSRDRHIKLHTGDRRYRCPHCETAFSRSDHLKIHMKTHDNQKPFQCTVCNRGYSTAAALTSHMQNHKKQAALLGTQGVNYSPRSTGSGSSGNSLKRKYSPLVDQQNLHTAEFLMSTTAQFAPNVQLSCEFCTMKFNSIPAVIQHIHTTHIDRLNSPNAYIDHLNRLSSNYNALASFRGDDLFKRKSGAIMQQQNLSIKPEKKSPDMGINHSMACDTRLNDTNDGANDTDRVDIKVEEQNSPTDLSNKRASSRDSKVDDDGDHAINLKDGAMSTPRTPSVLHNKQQSNKPDTYLCSHCNAAFPTFETFRIHLNNHLKQGELSMGNLIICQVCGLSIVNQSEYEQHMFMHFQSTSSEYACPVNCNKCYTKSEDLQKHLLETHAQNLWKCTVCNECFDSKVLIQVHMAVAHTTEVKVIRCQACMESFNSEKDFRYHVKSRHSVASHSGNMQCSFCHAMCGNDLEMQLHLMAHSRQFRCPVCPEIFHVEFLLDRHMQTHHCGTTKEPPVSVQYKTPNNNILNYQYSVAANNKNLYPLVSGNKLYNSNPLYGFYDSLKAGYGETANKHLLGLYSNELASKYYIGSNDNHIIPQTNVLVSQNERDHYSAEISKNDYFIGRSTASKTFGPSSRSTNTSGSTTETQKTTARKDAGLVCGICERNDFLTDMEVQTHRKLVHNIKTGVSLRCAYCNDNFRSRSELENHMKVNHNTNGKHKCLICDEVFPSPAVLAEHKLTHSKVGPSGKCSHCYTALNDVSAFKAHMSEHGSAESPTQCICCRQTLNSEYEIGLHAKFHTKSADNSESTCALCLIALPPNSDAKICEKCYKKHNFTQKYSAYGLNSTSMAMDTNDHNGVSKADQFIEHNCNICNKVLSSDIKLGEHLIEHSFQGCDDRGYTCYICSSVFTSTTGLHQHMNTHGPNSRPYDCNLCAAKFFFRAELENHLIEHEAGRISTTTMYNSVPAVVSTPQKDIVAIERSSSADQISDNDDKDEIETHEMVIKVESEERNDDDDEYIEIEKLVEYPLQQDDKNVELDDISNDENMSNNYESKSDEPNKGST